MQIYFMQLFNTKKALALLIILIISLTITDKFLFNYIPFWGLEYEDAYIYADTARFMLYDYPWSVDPFATKAVSIGSLNHPYETISYATHSDVFPIIIFIAHKIFGYWNYTPLLISSLSSILSYVILVIIALKNKDLPILRFILCTVAFLASPLARTFQSSGVSEAISSLPVLVTIIAFYLFPSTNNSKTNARLLVVVSILAYSMAILIKRENLILIILPFLAVINFPKLLKERNFLCSSIGVFVATLFYLFLIPPIKSFSSESSDIGTSAFSVYHFVCNAPKFIECFLRIDMWGISGYMLVAAIFFSRREWRNPRIQFPLVIFFIYFLAYTFHFRSRFQVQNGDVDAFEMMRFSTNIFPIAVLLIVNARIPVLNFSRRIIYTVSILGLAMVIYSSYHKIRFSQIEYAERIEPIKTAISLCGPNSALVTDVASLARIYGQDDLKIVETSSVSSVLSDSNILGGTVNFVVINRPNEFENLNMLFKNNGLILNKNIMFHSYDINVYSFIK